jgi:hypothetical protein
LKAKKSPIAAKTMTVPIDPQHAASVMLWKGRSIGSDVAVGGAVGRGGSVGRGVGLATVGTPITMVGVGEGVKVGGASVAVAT